MVHCTHCASAHHVTAGLLRWMPSTGQKYKVPSNGLPWEASALSRCKRLWASRDYNTYCLLSCPESTAQQPLLFQSRPLCLSLSFPGRHSSDGHLYKAERNPRIFQSGRDICTAVFVIIRAIYAERKSSQSHPFLMLNRDSRLNPAFSFKKNHSQDQIPIYHRPPHYPTPSQHQ